MPVAYNMPDTVYPVAGIRVGVASAGIKADAKPDLTLIELAENADCAAVFTRNAFCAAPVVIAKRHLATTRPRYLLVNSGCANAGTGTQGERDAVASCEALSRVAGCDTEQVLPFSTGVISSPLPVDKISTALPQLIGSLSGEGWQGGAQGIMTTDTVPKVATRQCEVAGKQVSVTGMSKGSGMIRPDMATMLAFIATDAGIESSLLHACLQNAVQQSFNCITVDGDTSTNDACVLVATGESGVMLKHKEDAGYDNLQLAVTEVCQELAQAIIRDAEGATKFVTIDVDGGNDQQECAEVAYTIAHSLLVKTALFASDPNWGRILAAVGRSPIPKLEISKVDISLGDVRLISAGEPAPGYTEAAGQQVMDQAEITISVNLNRGPARHQVWTSDLSYDYVKINAEYRT